MLRRLWRFLFGDPEPDPLIETMHLVVRSQEKTFAGVMEAVAAISAASAQQAQVLEQYLRLFQSTDPPMRWTEDMEADNKAQLLALGYPEGATETEQHKWLLDNLDAL